MREVYIICEADIIPEGYITRFDRNGYHCKNLFCPIDKRGFYLAQTESRARRCLAIATRKPIVFGFAEGVRVSLINLQQSKKDTRTDVLFACERATKSSVRVLVGKFEFINLIYLHKSQLANIITPPIKKDKMLTQ